MKTVIFMNECIKEKRPCHPVIRAVTGKDIAESNLFRIIYAGKEVGRIRFDPQNSPTDSHRVVAWVELYNGAKVSL